MRREKIRGARWQGLGRVFTDSDNTSLADVWAK